VYEDDQTQAFMDINPATEGHTLVVPKVHATDLFHLPEEVAAAMWRTVRTVGERAMTAFQANGLNVLMANRHAAFQTVFHAHVHVIPRYRIDELHLPWIPRAGDRARIEANGRRLREALGGED